MFNKHKLSTNKFVAAIKDTFVPPTSHTDITDADLELLFDSQQQQHMGRDEENSIREGMQE